MRKTTRHILLTLAALLLSAAAMAQTGKWRDIYTAKKKDTLYGICRQYDITLPQLLEANPEMKAVGYELKKGDTVFIPYATTQKPAAAPTSPKPVATVRQPLRVGVMLPLHDENGDGRRMVEYYRGLLMGIDSLRAQGISADVKAWNVHIEADIAETLKDPFAAQCDVIFGPLYTHQVRPLAEFCKARNIRIVIPFSISGDDVAQYTQIFQVWESPDKLNNSTIEAYVKRFGEAHTVFIDCNDKESKKGVFTFALRNRLTNKNMSYNITNLTSSEEAFQKAFQKGKRNVVVLNSGTSPNLTLAFAKIESLANRVPGLQITLFGYTEWLMYADRNADNFHRFDVHIPANFYYNSLDPRTRRLEQSYRKWFKQDMQYALPHFAITGYDHAQFFLRGMWQKGRQFEGTRGESNYRPLQTPLSFKQVGSAGMQNEYFQLIHYTTNKRIETIAY